MRWPQLLVLALALLSAPQALAVQPDEIMADPALEARARGLSKELRCMVCQNQSIDDSDAPLARDLRLLVRERQHQELRPSHGDYSAGCKAAFALAGLGAPTRSRRSESESAPPITITTAPSQISSTSGLR